MDEKKYTLEEAKQVLRNSECAQGRHAPTRVYRFHDDPIGIWYCDCGQTQWRPKTDTTEEESSNG